MTEAKWLMNGTIREKLDYLRITTSERKLRLFAGACCRRLTPHFNDERSIQMIDVSDLYADSLVDLARLDEVFHEAADVQETSNWEIGGAVDQSSAESVLGLRDSLDFEQIIAGTLECAGAISASQASEKMYGIPGPSWKEREIKLLEATELGVNAEVAVHNTLLRDIFGNPFRPVAFDPLWRTSTAVGIATAIYEDRAFDRMPILADAFQDAGCENEDILSHCRGDGPHVRGCWVVDLVLGKE